MTNNRALFSHFDDALAQAASALAACRAFDHQLHHDESARCSEATPCRLCHYDAAAAVAAVLLFFEERRLIDANGAWV
ncbi:MAG TPA: hypothetical protein VFJ17_12990 [Mycobacteriales bacterium]|nr:hypothetical protein [Mycobacteriales bacterium]